MQITNNTNQDYYFGPLHLPAGASGVTFDDTDDNSLYLKDDSVADAINTLYAAGKISVTPSAGVVFPRPTGTPEVLHGDGSPEGIVYAGQGSIYLRRDNNGGVQLYQKSTGIHLNTGWNAMQSSVFASPTGGIHLYAGASVPSGWLVCDGSAVSRTTYADLYTALGGAVSPWGQGDGSATFNVPDLRGRVPVGLGTNASVNAQNKNDGQAVGNRRPHHQTSKSDPGHQHSSYTEAGGGSGGTWKPARNDQVNWAYDTGLANAPATTGITVGTNVGTDAVDTPSFVVVNYIIKT